MTIRLLGRRSGLLLGASVSAFSPLSLVPAAWYKADTGAYSDAGTTLATNGQTVQQINDQSGNGWHLSQATSGSRATLRANGGGDIGSLQFTGDKYYTNSNVSFVNAATQLEWFAILEYADFLFLFRTGASGAGMVPYRDSSNSIMFFGYPVPATQGGASLLRPGICHSIYDGTQGTKANRLNHNWWNYPLSVNGGNASTPAALDASNGFELHYTGDTSGSFRLSELVMFNRTLSAGERASMYAYMRSRYALGTRANVMCVGDSLTSGVGGGPYPTLLQTSLGLTYKVGNMGIGGTSLTGQWLPTYSTGFSYPLTSASHAKDVEVVWLGTNDLGGSARTAVQVEGDLTTYWALRRAAGYKILAGTIIARNDASWSAGKETQRLALNTWINSQSGVLVDAVVDLAANAHLSNGDDTTYYTVDKLHLNDTGYGVVAGLVATAVQAL